MCFIAYSFLSILFIPKYTSPKAPEPILSKLGLKIKFLKSKYPVCIFLSFGFMFNIFPSTKKKLFPV